MANDDVVIFTFDGPKEKTREEGAGHEAREDFVKPYEYKACSHGVWIADYLTNKTATYCPDCNPGGPVDYVAFGWLPTILKAVGKRGFIRGSVDTENLNEQHNIRGDARENLINAIRVHLLEKREILTERAAVIGWNTPQMKGYVRRVCENYIISAQTRGASGRELDIERRHKEPLTQPAFDEDGPDDQGAEPILDVACGITGKPFTAGQIEDMRNGRAPDYDTRMLDVNQALVRIPVNLRLAVEARFGTIEGNSATWKDTAAVLNCSIPAARWAVDKAIKMLREELGVQVEPKAREEKKVLV